MTAKIILIFSKRFKSSLLSLRSNKKFKASKAKNDRADINVRKFSFAILLAANKIEPIAPTDAASVGVAKPVSIDPSTAMINARGGNKVLNNSL